MQFLYIYACFVYNYSLYTYISKKMSETHSKFLAETWIAADVVPK